MELDITTIVIAVVSIVGSLLAIAKVITSLTPSEKDDKVVKDIDDAVSPLLNKLGDSEKQ